MHSNITKNIITRTNINYNIQVKLDEGNNLEENIILKQIIVPHYISGVILYNDLCVLVQMTF